MTSDTEGVLDIPQLPKLACKAYIVPAMQNQSLISIGQLCDSGCKVQFDNTSATVTHENHVIFTGTRNPDSKLWFLHPVFEKPTGTQIESCNSAIGSVTPENLVAFAHAALFSPALTTLETALKKGFLINFPGLSLTTLRKYPPASIAMVKGHLDQIRTNVRSTKPRAAIFADTASPVDIDTFPNSPESPERDSFFTDLLNVPETTGQIYSDQTGRFVSPSSSGNNYILIVYDYDSNAILARPMTSRTGKCILTAYQSIHEQLVKAGRRPKLQKLDNECSQALKDFLSDEKIDYQLVPPGIHRRNAAERAIRTFKNHFIAGLCSTDPLFPVHLWDHLLEQAVLTLNLVRGSRVNPKLSAWAQLHGQFDYNATPIAPPGIKVMVHDKPATRGTWAPHAVEGWYLGPALQSYRCYKCYIIDTQSTRITDTIAWFPRKIPMPTPSSNDMILAGIKDIVHAMNNPHPATITPLTPSAVSTLKTITELFHSSDEDNSEAADTVPALPSDKAIEALKDVPLPDSVNVAPLRVTDLPQGLPSGSPVAPLRVMTPAIPVQVLPSNTPTEVPLTTSDTYPEIVSHHGRLRRRRAKKLAKQVQLPTPAAAPSRPRRHIVRTQFNPRTHQREFSANSSVTVHINETHECAYLGHAVNPDTGKIADYQTLLRSSVGQLWEGGAVDEFGLLLHGNGTTILTGTDTMRFVAFSVLPLGYKPTYVTFVCAYRPEKPNPYRVRMTLGGDRIEYDGETSTKTADLTTCKVHFNKVISIPGGRFCTTDIKFFYLNTMMEEKDWVYAKIPIASVPQQIIDMYKLQDLVHNGFVYVQVRKGMYGLKQAGKLANDLLITNLAQYGYAPCPITPGLWKHATRPISFTLVVDDFGICYSNKDDADHLLHALEQHYKISTDWSGTKYCGLTLDWDYKNSTVDISMPGYVERALERLQHLAPIKPQRSPHQYTTPTYGARVQYTAPIDESPLLDAKDNKRIQEIIGIFLYYCRGVDPTGLVALGTLATQQNKGTQQTMKDVTHLLNYFASNPDAVIRYTKSGMTLHSHSDASYLSEKNARSRVGGYHYLSTPYSNVSDLTQDNYNTPHNGPIHVVSQIMKEVLSSAAEAELAGLFHNAKEICPIRIMLEEMGFPQPATPLQTDNSTACGIVNDTVKQRRSKSIDMRFYWVRDRVKQGQFFVYWKKGSTNKADYFTKHHSPSHHIQMRHTILHPSSHNRFALLASTDDDPEDFPLRIHTTGSNTDSLPGLHSEASLSSVCCEGVLKSSSGLRHTSSDATDKSGEQPQNHTHIELTHNFQ